MRNITRALLQAKGLSQTAPQRQSPGAQGRLHPHQRGHLNTTRICPFQQLQGREAGTGTGNGTRVAVGEFRPRGPGAITEQVRGHVGGGGTGGGRGPQGLSGPPAVVVSRTEKRPPGSWGAWAPGWKGRTAGSWGSRESGRSAPHTGTAAAEEVLRCEERKCAS